MASFCSVRHHVDTVACRIHRPQNTMAESIRAYTNSKEMQWPEERVFASVRTQRIVNVYGQNVQNTKHTGHPSINRIKHSKWVWSMETLEWRKKCPVPCPQPLQTNLKYVMCTLHTFCCSAAAFSVISLCFHQFYADFPFVRLCVSVGFLDPAPRFCCIIPSQLFPFVLIHFLLCM